LTPARKDLARQRGFTVTDDIDAFLDDPLLDAVLIATPTASHFEPAMKCLARGKHVMVEKPMSLNATEALQLVEQAERCGRVLSVFQNRRWDVDYLTVRAAIDSGVMGRLINVESRLGQFASCVGPAAKEYRPGWRNEGACGGGGLYDWGSHFVDQIWRLMLPRKPVLVFAQLRGNVWTSDCDDFARVCIDFDDGAVGLVEINTTTTRPLPRWHVDATGGSASSPPSATFDTHEWARLTFTPADFNAPSVLPVPEVGLTEVDLWNRFVDACAGTGEPAVTARSVLPTMHLLDAARTSSREGRAVDVTHLHVHLR
jgi:predicted dehydrogenase